MADLRGKPTRIPSRAPISPTEKTVRVHGGQILICDDFCRPARAGDLGEVLELLPELLTRLKGAQRGTLWRAMAALQRSGAQ